MLNILQNILALVTQSHRWVRHSPEVRTCRAPLWSRCMRLEFWVTNNSGTLDLFPYSCPDESFSWSFTLSSSCSSTADSLAWKFVPICISFRNICLNAFFFLRILFLSFSFLWACRTTPYPNPGTFLPKGVSSAWIRPLGPQIGLNSLHIRRQQRDGCISLLIDAQWPHFSEPHLFSKSLRKDLSQQKGSLGRLQQQGCCSWLWGQPTYSALSQPRPDQQQALPQGCLPAGAWENPASRLGISFHRSDWVVCLCHTFRV